MRFCDLRIHVDPGVFVPRPHTQAMAQRAVSLLPADGIAVDLCTGSGAVAAVLGSVHPKATVVATDIDPVAVACARRNGVHALVGDLDDPLPPSLRGLVDVMTAVVPYVPTDELPFLPRDVLANEPRGALPRMRLETRGRIACWYSQKPSQMPRTREKRTSPRQGDLGAPTVPSR